MVHELTHVLQDQIFDLDQLTEADATSGELAAFRALVEGDAGRIEDSYEATLSDEEQAAIDAAEANDTAAVEGEEIPEALEAIFGLPYALGGGFVLALEAESDDAVDAAFRSPPTTEEHLLDPESYFDDDEAIGVDAPDVGDAEVLDAGDFGAASLYLVLASRIDLAQALRASIGWGGDAYVNYLQDDRTCVDLNVTGDEPSDVDELDAALVAWVAAGPSGTASLVREGDLVRLHACDPGVDAAGGTGSAFDALALAVTRTAIITELIAAGADEGFVRCYVDAVLAAFTVEELTGSEPPAEFDARIADVAIGCA